LVHGVGGPEEGLICLVMSNDTLTPAEKNYILQIVKATLQIDSQVVDTAQEGPGYEFDGHHYGAWGKMSRSVCFIAPSPLAPSDGIANRENWPPRECILVNS
jgi:hypothetical protein